MTSALASFVLRRALTAVFFVLVVSSAAFVLARLSPGDATTTLRMSGASPQAIDAERARLGLDRSLPAHLFAWAGGLVRLDFGQSSTYGRPVADLVAERLANTALLASIALLAATAIGLPLGVLTGSRPHGALSLFVTIGSTALVACPPIVGVLVLLFVAVSTGWLSVAPGAIAVPALALALPLGATLERLQSRATADALASPDLTAGAARGLPPARLLWIHTTRQSLRPVLGVYGIMIGSLLSGSLAVETIANWPGIGRLTYDALIGRDLFLIAGCALAGAVLISAGNLAADLARAWIDPRVAERQ